MEVAVGSIEDSWSLCAGGSGTVEGPAIVSESSD